MNQCSVAHGTLLSVLSENEWQRRYDQSIEAVAEREAAALAQASGTKRTVAAALGTFSMVVRLTLLPAYLLFAAILIAQRTVAGVAVGIGLLMLMGLSAFKTSQQLRRRRERNRNWLTGLP